jgi:glutamine synthetase
MNELSRFLDKPPDDFTKKDIIRYVAANGIRFINFRYVGGDGKLKTLNFGVASLQQVDKLLSMGERVDGSSLFGCVDTSTSDLYVVPRFRTAFVNPVSAFPSVDILCSYYTSEGLPFEGAPEQVVRKAHQVLLDTTELKLEAMAELEYYVLYEKDPLYRVEAQRGYHESTPFSKWEALRCEAIASMVGCGLRVKYGHSEVGNAKLFEQEGEQHEIEFEPVPVEDAADQIAVAKWLLRTVAHKYGVTISFAPKISTGDAGSGLHVHTRLAAKDGSNAMVDGNHLSDIAVRATAGYMRMASSLTAFGNTIPTSYLRLVPNQEAPTSVCWGERNRSVLVRVPLGWLGVGDMVGDSNPLEEAAESAFPDRQTVEFRGPDGSAHVYLLLAGLAVAARRGMEMQDALELAERLRVDGRKELPPQPDLNDQLLRLPTSCWESAEALQRDRSYYEARGVFPTALIDAVLSELRRFNDKDLDRKLHDKEDEIRRLVARFLHCS